jgi:hypothetical protein
MDWFGSLGVPALSFIRTTWFGGAAGVNAFAADGYPIFLQFDLFVPATTTYWLSGVHPEGYSSYGGPGTKIDFFAFLNDVDDRRSGWLDIVPDAPGETYRLLWQSQDGSERGPRRIPTCKWHTVRAEITESSTTWKANDAVGKSKFWPILEVPNGGPAPGSTGAFDWGDGNPGALEGLSELYVFLGARSPSGPDSTLRLFVDRVRVGSTLGGAEYFNGHFEDGGFADFTSAHGVADVVNIVDDICPSFPAQPAEEISPGGFVIGDEYMGGNG